MNATEILLNNGIAPRYQYFINEDNKDEVEHFMKLIENLHINERVQALGMCFRSFINPGTCDRENENLYQVRINKSSLPVKLKNYILDYDELMSEQELVEILKNDQVFYVPDYGDSIVLNINNKLDVFIILPICKMNGILEIF